MTATDPVSSFAARLRQGEQLFLAWSALPEPLIGDVLVRAGFDAVLFDMQHGLHDVSSATRGIQAVAGSGRPALVRIPVGDNASASRMLDAGAAGIVAPMVNSAADAQVLVAFTKYPPLGSRSWGPGRALALTGMTGDAFLHRANGTQLAIAMIETPAAIEALDDILGLAGIDGALVGPSDLSITLNYGQALDPFGAGVDTAMRHIADRCRHHRKIASAFCANGERARIAAAMGYTLCAVGTDQYLLDAAARHELDRARRATG